jgi:hypothetical protein
MKQRREFAARTRQRGITLAIAMILMLVLTIVVLSAIRTTNVNAKVVGNMQIQRESEAAAQQAIETVISSDFSKAPAATSVNVDINDSGKTTATYVVRSPAPVCTSVKPIKLSELDAANPADRPCYVSGTVQNAGIEGAGATGNSLCSNSNWDLSATAQAPGVTNSKATTHQGVAQRVAVGSAC